MTPSDINVDEALDHNAMYQAVWSQWVYRDPDQLCKYLRFFYRYHRAVDGHVWIRDADSNRPF